jgi:heme-degrading monooxygenase HmoA
MFARLTKMKVKPGKMKELEHRTRTITLLENKAKEGFHGAMLLIDQRSGNTIGLSLWDTEEALIAVEESGHYEASMAGYTDIFDGDFEREVYEVAVKSDDI